jgi:hypothetical protein
MHYKTPSGLCHRCCTQGAIDGAALPHGNPYLAITPEPFPLECFTVPVAALERPSFPLETSNRMVPIEEENQEFW